MTKEELDSRGTVMLYGIINGKRGQTETFQQENCYFYQIWWKYRYLRRQEN